MPVHDWRKVDAGIFHDFHLSWLAEIKKTLNAGILPASYYALAEQIAGNFWPDVLTLQAPSQGSLTSKSEPTGGVALAETPPRVRFHARAEIDRYAAKARSIVIRHRSGHRVVAVIEVVSPGNKDGQTEFAAFVEKAKFAAFVEKANELLRSGIHLMVIDLFPPTRRDPDVIHRAIWDHDTEGDFALPADKPLTCVSYVGYPELSVYLEPLAVGDRLPEMPLFLTPEVYVPVPLEETYLDAWAAVPEFWREQILAASPRNGSKKTGRGRKKKG